MMNVFIQIMITPLFFSILFIYQEDYTIELSVSKV